MKRRRLFMAAGSAWVLLASGLVAGSPAAAGSPVPSGERSTGSDGVPAMVPDQSRQEALWRDVNKYVDSHKARGFAGGRFEPDGLTVRIFWAGDPPVELSKVAAKHTSASVMTVTRVPLDRPQFVAAARRLVDEATRAGIQVVSAGRTPDVLGTRVRLEGSATEAEKDTLQGLGATEILEGEGALIPLASRHADLFPYYGGGVMTGGPGYYCSTGWAVYKADNSKAMVTAQHCGTNRNWATWGSPAGGSGNSNNYYVGSSDSGHALTDSMLITGGGYTGAVFVGPWNSTSGRFLNDAVDPPLWSFICAEGGMSGEVCNGRVEDVDQVGPKGGGPGFYARSSDGVTALAGKGDSGSPAIAFDGGRVVLRGLLSQSSGDHPADCAKAGNNPWYEWKDPTNGKYRTCYSEVFYINQSEVHAALNVRPDLF
jgi:hypothetical protein